jgi:ATP-binding cassette, subfamily B, multidrug efflux pump
VRDLAFRFADADHDVLQGLSFEAEPGMLVAITGPVGSGKSALATVLTGLYPYNGSVCVGNRELRDLSVSERVQTIAYSGQDAFLFSASIAQNITLQTNGAGPGDEDRSSSKDDAALQRALADSALADDMPLFPEGLASVVGERGVRVSGGQRQRISLARALYAGSPLLVLDDPFSAVDIGTERRMIAQLRAAREARTLFVFSHRLAAFAEADLILVLNGGRLVESGTHSALMAAGGIYATIYQAQDWLVREDYG